MDSFLVGNSSDKYPLRVYDIIIDSRFRQNYDTTSPSNYVIDMQNPINNRIIAYGLKSACIPKTTYNIPKEYNTFTFQDSTGPHLVTIPEGQYDINALIAEIQILMNAASTDGYLVTYSTLTGRITIANATGDFLFNSIPSVSTSSVVYKLGFNPTIQYSSTLQSLRSEFVTDISGIKNLFIRINQLTQYVRNAGNTLVNFKVEYPGCFGSIVYYNDENRCKQYFNIAQDTLTNLRYFNIQLLDENNEPINLNGRDWTFVLQLITRDHY